MIAYRLHDEGRKCFFKFSVAVQHFFNQRVGVKLGHERADGQSVLLRKLRLADIWLPVSHPVVSLRWREGCLIF